MCTRPTYSGAIASRCSGFFACYQLSCHCHALLASHALSAALQIAALPCAVLGNEGSLQLLGSLRCYLNSAIQRTTHPLRGSATTTSFHRLQQIIAVECRAQSLGAIVHERWLTEGGKCFLCCCHNVGKSITDKEGCQPRRAFSLAASHSCMALAVLWQNT